jgi:hypothetical protein
MHLEVVIVVATPFNILKNFNDLLQYLLKSLFLGPVFLRCREFA